MRGMSIGYKIVGALFVVVGIAWAVFAGSIASWGFAGSGIGLIIGGFVFLFVGRHVGRLAPKSIDNAILGSAEVLAVADTGVTIGGLNAVFTVRLRVTLPGQAPYDADTRVTLDRPQWGVIQPGMVVGVRVDPDDRSKVELNGEMPVGGAAQQGSPAGLSFQGQPMTTMTGADVVAQGIASEGRCSASR